MIAFYIFCISFTLNVVQHLATRGVGSLVWLQQAAHSEQALLPAPFSPAISHLNTTRFPTITDVQILPVLSLLPIGPHDKFDFLLPRRCPAEIDEHPQSHVAQVPAVVTSISLRESHDVALLDCSALSTSGVESSPLHDDKGAGGYIGMAVVVSLAIWLLLLLAHRKACVLEVFKDRRVDFTVGIQLVSLSFTQLCLAEPSS